MNTGPESACPDCPDCVAGHLEDALCRCCWRCTVDGGWLQPRRPRRRPAD